MVVHFIGGPWHGEDRDTTESNTYIYGVQLSFPKWNPRVEPVSNVPYERFEYRRIGPPGATVAGLTLYEYVEPTVEVEVAVRKRVPQSKAEQTRTELVRELHLPEGGRLHYSGLARD